MSNRLGRALRGGLSLACLWLLALPAVAQIRNEGAIPDGRGGVGVLTTGVGHTCGLRQDGSASCWGNNHNGQATPPPGAFMELSAGFEHTCGLRGDGSVECWGDGYTAMEGEPPPPLPPMMSGTFTALASGISQTCGLRARAEPWQYPEGNVACWTASGWGPTPPPPPAGDFAALSLGDDFACGLRADGRAECWGSIDPASVPEGAFIAVSAGARHACGLQADGSVQCWGDNWGGQATAPAELFTAISAGAFNTCGIRTDNRVQCWGENWAGQSTPPEDRFIAVSAGVHHACGVRTDGQVACWGNVDWGNYYGMPPRPFEGVFGVGQMAAGDWHHCQVNPEGRLTCWGAFQLDPAPWARFNAVSSGQDSSCARDEDGRLQCFGYNGGIHDGLPLEPLRQFDVGYEHGCAVLALDGRAQCWGRETNGKTLAPEGLFRNLSAGLVHSCGVTAEGNGQCWGFDGDGQSTVPPLPPERGFLTIQAGERHSCGLDGELHIKCWGQSPPPYDPWQFDPQYHPDFATFRALSVGSYHSCAIRTDGRLLCWGQDWYDQLRVPEGTFVAVSAGRGNTCAIRTDGRRECWGEPWLSPKLALYPDHLPGTRPGHYLHVPFDLRSESSYQVQEPRYAIVAGTLPLGFRLEADGTLHGSWHETGRFPITVEGRDRNGFAMRRDFVLSIDDTAPLIEPQVSGTTGENGWYTSPVDVAWSVSDPESEIRWSVGCDPAHVEYETIGAGFFCHAESAGGMAFRELQLQVDLFPPHVLLQSFENTGALARFEFDGHDPTSGLAGFECSLDGAGFAPCASPLVSTFGPGEHEMQIRAVDAAGHRSEPVSQRWFADATAPFITAAVTGPLGQNDWYTGDVHIAWTVIDDESPITSIVGCNTVTLNTDTPEAGFTCTATSGGGTASQTVYIKRDATAPETVFTATPPTATSNTNAIFEFGGTDATAGGVRFECSLNGTAYIACSSPWWIAVVPGRYRFDVRAVDAAGNRDATPVTHNWVVDRTPPVVESVVTGTLGPNGWYVGPVKVSWFVGDAESPVTSASGCSPTTLATDSPGASFTCTATSAGGSTSKTVAVKVDLTAPETTLTSVPDQPVNSPHAEFVFSGSDATSGVAGFRCSLDGAASTPCVSPLSVNVGAGSHSLLVMAIDAVGFNDPTPASHHWVVDGTPPLITPTVTGTKNTVDWYNDDVQISWVVADPESTIGSTSGCNDFLLTTDTPMASFTCTAGSVGGSSNQTVHVRRDATPPETVLTSTPGGTGGQFEFTGQDAVAGVRYFECSLDGSAFVACQPPHPYQVAAGPHVFRVRAVDYADNRDPTPAQYSWVIDATPPQIVPTISGTQGNNGWYVGDVSISWTVSDPDSTVTDAACDPVVLGTDTAGTSFSCTASSAGGSSTRTVTVKRDATAPSITAAANTAPNAAGWYNGSVVVGFTCSDALSGVASACATAQTLTQEGTSISGLFTVVDAAGNSATSNVVTARIDRTAPTLAPTVTPGTLLLNATAAASANGADALSGIVSEQCAPLATAGVGTKTSSCTVTDAAGNSATANAGYRVVYGFVGFSAPVQNPAVLNVLKAGRSAPFRWRVIDAQGAPVSNLTSAAFAATAIGCPVATENRIATYGGNNDQLQNLGNGYYQLDWMAAASLRNSCRRLDLNLGDGQPRSAQFKFN